MADVWTADDVLSDAPTDFAVSFIHARALGHLFFLGPIGSNFKYEIATDTWTVLTDPPEVRDWAWAHQTRIGDAIWAFGHDGDKVEPFRYNIGTDTWDGPFLDRPLETFLLTYTQWSATMFDNKLYVLGPVDGTQVYDPSADTWTQETSGPNAANSMRQRGIAVFDDEIWLVGGWTGPPGNSTDSELVDIYNPVTDSWRAGPALSLLSAGQAIGVTVADRRLWAGGGEHALSAESGVFQSTEGTTWTAETNMPHNAGGFKLLTHKNLIYAGAPRATPGLQNAIWRFDPILVNEEGWGILT